MPKTGLTAQDWNSRLWAYAEGKFVFGRGQRPATGTRWSNLLFKIDTCPRHASTGKDLFGNAIQCTCTYHVPKVRNKENKKHLSSATSRAQDMPAKESRADVETVPKMSSQSVQYDLKQEYLSRLPAGWDGNMSEGDRLWIGKALFHAKGRLKDTLQFWWYPPSLAAESGSPDVRAYFLHPLFLWMPRKMLGIDFKCPECERKQDSSLRSKGLYRRVRPVLDVRGYYHLATEYLYCKLCLKQYLAYDARLLDQLTDAMRGRFPVLLTHKYACDRAVVSLLRSRTLGNSPTAMRNSIQEIHSENWLREHMIYLADCARHRQASLRLNLPVDKCEEVPPFRPLATPKWFLACYVRDVYNRLEMLKGMVTSTFGCILKIDSTKKVCKKLQGEACKNAQWATNVGNERGEVLMSILTTSESVESLQDMADGLMARYQTAQQEPPKCLYTDRECCSHGGPSKFKVLFSRWQNLEVRLDIWHFMRRLALGCTSESHPLYGVFMSRLSSAIFEWDKGDLEKLKEAKKSELKMAGVPDPSESAVLKAITRKELESHCRRRTKGEAKTREDIESLILGLSGVTDGLGVSILKAEMKNIWQEQKRHVACIQDIPGLQLYTIVGQLVKGKHLLPVFRCARGSTSLECFHSHLVKFIPGTSANAVNFQAYLLDGITRWNYLRSTAALQDPAVDNGMRTYDVRLMQRVNSLSQAVLNKPAVSVSMVPSVYSGEKIGVEYLYMQSGFSLPTDGDLDAQIDEGFEDMAEDQLSEPVAGLVDNVIPAGPICQTSDEEQESAAEMESDEDSVCVDSRGIPGWDKVDRLAQALIALTGLAISSSQAAHIKELYDALIEYDKQPITYKIRLKKTSKGRFGRSKSGFVGVDAMKRCFLSGGSPASSPSKSRVVEAICIHLCDKISTPQKDGRYTSRWKLILSAYNGIRQRLLNSEDLLEGTDLILLVINEATLTKWYKEHTRRSEIKMLLQGLSLPGRTTADEPLAAPMERPTEPPMPEVPMEFEEPPDTTGQATRRVRHSSPLSVPPNTVPVAQEDKLLVYTAAPPVEPHVPKAAAPKPISRTTEWRRRKKSGETKKERKVYTCRVCDEPISTEGHTQFRGQRYCPHAPNQIAKEEWLLLRRAEAAQKKGTLGI